MAEFAVRHGALGIAEYHDLPYARELIVELMTSGLVRHLFLEVPGNGGAAVSLRTALDLHARGATRESLTSSLNLLSMENPHFPLEKLAALAISKSIPVHCADGDCAVSKSAFSLGPVGMARRNQAAVDAVRKQTGCKDAHDKEAIGSVILFGIKHFILKSNSTIPNSTIPDLFPGLCWVDMTAPKHTLPSPALEPAAIHMSD